jgi:hypothetical protein
VKFRRKRTDGDEIDTAADEPTPDGEAVAAEGAAGVSGARANGPWDISEVELPDPPNGLVDLGSLLVRPREGVELQLQVDEQHGHVVACILAGADGAVELRPFAAPRNGDIWPEVRSQIAAEVTRRGGTATEAVGPWGPELRVVLSVKSPDGQTGTQPSRVFGIAGPRWLLRATFFGRPALEPDEAGAIESALRDVIVRRGGEPHAPGDALPLAVPPNAAPNAAPGGR